ncbi:hypothetical protein M5E86_12075 [Blautia wexlerae]|nr:hypothetical protein M5E86_12075 [Blautia wexlerae]
MTTVERLEELKTVDIKEIERDSLPKYKDLISELDSRKSNKMEVSLNHSDNPYVYEDMGYVVKSVFNASSFPFLYRLYKTACSKESWIGIRE